MEEGENSKEEMPLRKTKERASQESHYQESVPRFAERPLMSHKDKRGMVKDILISIPYPSVMATIFLLIGIIMTEVCGRKAIALARHMVEKIAKRDISNIERVSTILTAFTVLVVIYGLCALIFACLSTGMTRYAVFRRLSTRIGGQFTCIFLVFFCSIEIGIWMFVFWYVSYLMTYIDYGLLYCHHYFRNPDVSCRSILFIKPFLNPGVTPIVLCSVDEKLEFCNDFEEESWPLYVLTITGVTFILKGLMMDLVCEATNFVRLECDRKARELRELTRLES